MTEIPQKLLSQSAFTGIFYLFCSMLFFSGVDVCSKTIVQYASPVFTNILRYTLLIIAVLLIMGRENRQAAFKLTTRKELLLRGFFQGGTGLFYLMAVQTLPLSLASALYFAAPLVLVALSPLFLGEKIAVKQWIAVLMGLCGMLIIVRPSGEMSMSGVMWILAAMLCQALLHIYTRRLSFKVNNWHQIFYGNVGALILGLFALPLMTELPKEFNPNYLFTLLIMICFTVGGQIFLVKAFSATPASLLAPFNYFQLIFVLILSYLIFGETLDGTALIGIVTIIFGGIYASSQKIH